MSMDRVRDSAENARRALGQLASDVRNARREAHNQLQGLDRETEHVLTGARAAVQAIDDQRQPLIEELGQLDGVLSPPPAPAAPAPGSPDNVPTQPDTPVVHPEPPAEPAPETPAPTAEANANASVHVSIGHRINPRNWGPWQWLGAFAGLIVAFLVWRTIPDWAGQNIEDNTTQGIIDVLWAVAVLGFGFFGGGLLGWFIQSRRSE